MGFLAEWTNKPIRTQAVTQLFFNIALTNKIADLGLDVLTSLSLGQYIKTSVQDFPVMTSLAVNKWYVISI